MTAELKHAVPYGVKTIQGSGMLLPVAVCLCLSFGAICAYSDETPLQGPPAMENMELPGLGDTGFHNIPTLSLGAELQLSGLRETPRTVAGDETDGRSLLALADLSEAVERHILNSDESEASRLDTSHVLDLSEMPAEARLQAEAVITPPHESTPEKESRLSDWFSDFVTNWVSVPMLISPGGDGAQAPSEVLGLRVFHVTDEANSGRFSFEAGLPVLPSIDGMYVGYDFTFRLGWRGRF